MRPRPDRARRLPRRLHAKGSGRHPIPPGGPMHSFVASFVRCLVAGALLLAATRAAANDFYSMSTQFQLCQKTRAEVLRQPAKNKVRIVDDCSLHFRQGPKV